MTARTYAFLRADRAFSLVPVTTRTLAQYRRLTFPDALGVRFALPCNGGRLLDRGEEDEAWARETLSLAAPELPDLREAAKLLAARCPEHELHEPDPWMVYAVSGDPAADCAALRGLVNPESVVTAFDRRKVYLIARSVNKGAAVRRFIRAYGVGACAAAGDDPLDVPMLCEADYPYPAPEIASLVTGTEAAGIPGEVFSDRVCAFLEVLSRSGKI